MKNKIMNSRPILWLTETKFSRFLAGNRFLNKIWNYEMITYMLFGAGTTIVNYVIFFLMPRFETSWFPGLDIILASTVSWIGAVLFAFVTNKIFVYDSPSWAGKIVLRELALFVACRIISFFVDTAIVYVACGLFNLNEPLFKVLASIFVLISNFFASKFIVFKKPKTEVSEHD